MGEPLVVCRGVTKRYGSVPALEDVSLQIPEGTVGLLGPNGAGKTTLIRLMLGLTRPTGGTLTVLGHEAPTERLTIRRKVGYSPEIESFFPGMKAIEAVSFSAQLSGMPGSDAFKRAHELLYFVGLDEARYRKVEGFSTGMKQRVKIAQALVHDPKLLVLDEPTSGLDPTGRDEILDLIKDLPKRRGPNVLLSTHILGDVERVCGHATIMQNGRSVASGTLEELLGTGRETYDVQIEGEVDSFASELHARGIECKAKEDGRLCVRPREGPFDTRKVFSAALAAGVSIRQFGKSRISLDEAFVKMVG